MMSARENSTRELRLRTFHLLTTNNSEAKRPRSSSSHLRAGLWAFRWTCHSPARSRHPAPCCRRAALRPPSAVRLRRCSGDLCGERGVRAAGPAVLRCVVLCGVAERELSHIPLSLGWVPLRACWPRVRPGLASGPLSAAAGTGGAPVPPLLHRTSLGSRWGLERSGNRESSLCVSSFLGCARSSCPVASLTSLWGLLLNVLCFHFVLRKVRDPPAGWRPAYIRSHWLFYCTSAPYLRYAPRDSCFVLSVAMASGTALIYDEAMTRHKLLWNE